MPYDYEDDDPTRQPVIPSGFVKLDEIQGETETKWLWPDKVPLGHVTIVAGEASSGKSLLAAEIAARVSSGAGWPGSGNQSLACTAANKTPDAERPTGSVLIAHSNQHENLVLKGRLLAAGADASCVAIVNRDVFERDIGGDDEGDDETSPAEASLMALEGALVQLRDASLVIVDHLLGWLGRSRLQPEELTSVFNRLQDMAARYRVALVVLWRLEKGGRAAQTRALDALSGAAPVVWLLANDPYSPQSRRAVGAQNRLGAPSDDLAFRVASGRLVWQEAVRQVSADDVLAARTADRHERRQAGQWLLDLLSQGPIEAQQLWHEARQCGLAERTLRRAAAELALHPTKDGKRNVWLWDLCSPTVASDTLDPTMPTLPADTAIQSVAALLNVGSLAASPVVGVELRRDAPPSVTGLPAVGNLSDADVALPEVSASEQTVAVLPAVGSLARAGTPDELSASEQAVAALPPVDSLADAGGTPEEVSASEQTVAALPPVEGLADADAADEDVSEVDQKLIDVVCRDAESDDEEQKLLAEVIAAATASDGDGDAAEPAESPSARKRRLRRERRFIARTLRICRDG